MVVVAWRLVRFCGLSQRTDFEMAGFSHPFTCSGGAGALTAPGVDLHLST